MNGKDTWNSDDGYIYIASCGEQRGQQLQAISPVSRSMDWYKARGRELVEPEMVSWLSTEGWMIRRMPPSTGARLHFCRHVYSSVDIKGSQQEGRWPVVVQAETCNSSQGRMIAAIQPILTISGLQTERGRGELGVKSTAPRHPRRLIVSRSCFRRRHIGIASLAPTAASGTGAARSARSTVPLAFHGPPPCFFGRLAHSCSTYPAARCNTTQYHCMQKSSLQSQLNYAPISTLHRYREHHRLLHAESLS